MKRIITEIYNAHKTLVILSIISSLILIFFLTLQYFNFSGLKLDIKWIIVSGIPILVGLFIAGYIKNLKGFGLELEASLKAEIPSNLITTISDYNIVDKFGIDKQSLILVENLDESVRQKISRIRFVLGKAGHYDIYVIRQYLYLLENLKYIEIVNSNNEFKFLLPISYLKSDGNIDFNRIEIFVNQIENSALNSSIPGSISDYVNSSDSLLKAYRKLLRVNSTIIVSIGDTKLPVLDRNKKVIGLLSKIKVEEFISKEVLENFEEKNSSI